MTWSNETKGRVAKSSIIGWLWYKDDIGTMTALYALGEVWADRPANMAIGGAISSRYAGPIGLAYLVGTESGQKEVEAFMKEYQEVVQENILGDLSPHQLPSTGHILMTSYTEGRMAMGEIPELLGKFFKPSPYPVF